MRMRVLVAAAGLFAGAALTAQESKTQPKGERKPALPADVVPSTFRAFLVTDGRFPDLKSADGKTVGPDPRNRKGKIHCLVCEIGDSPAIAVFVRADLKTIGPDSGLAKLTKTLDQLVPKYRSDKLSAFVIFLRLEGGTKVVTLKNPDGSETKVEQDMEYPDDEKRDLHAKDIADFSAALTVPNVPMGLAAEKSKAVTAWKVNDADAITAIVYNRMRIVGKPWTFAQAADLTDEKVAEIVKAIQSAIAAKR